MDVILKKKIELIFKLWLYETLFMNREKWNGHIFYPHVDFVHLTLLDIHLFFLFVSNKKKRAEHLLYIDQSKQGYAVNRNNN